MKIGILVGEKGDAKFFEAVFEEIRAHHDVDVFTEKVFRTPLLYGRLNRWAFHRGIRTLLHRNEVCFFEWASELLVPASYMPKSCSIVTRLHSYELYAWAPKVNWDHVDKIILVSQAMREKFNDLYPDHAHKTEVVYSACSPERFKPAQRSFNFSLGMLCSIHPRKRIYEIIIMLSRLKQQGYEAKLHIAGGRIHGGDLDEYFVATHRLVQKLNLNDSVFFYGHLDDPGEWLQMIDIFISNAYWEGMPVSLVEAMSAGCYCFSHCWDGAEEALPVQNLYISELELEQKIIEYSNLPEEVRKKYQTQMQATANAMFNMDRNKVRIRQIIESFGREQI